jgi:uncharacterized lipoprotein YmbA
MDKSRIARIAYVTIFVGVMILTACGGRTPPAKFYTLQSVHPSSPGKSLPADVAIAVGPVAIPAAHDRQEIVTRGAKNEVSFSEYHRWAGPLQKNIAAVLSQNIGALLGTERITPFTRENIFRPTHRVVININRYDSQFSKEFLLETTWSIKAIQGNQTLLVQRSIVRKPLGSSTYEDLVAAQNQALGTLSEEIANAFMELMP